VAGQRDGAGADVIDTGRSQQWKDGYDAGRRVSQAQLDQARRGRDRLERALRRLVVDVENHGSPHVHGAAPFAAHAELERPEARPR
jgi:hypothetical protein